MSAQRLLAGCDAADALVPRLRGVSHAFAFVLSIAAAVIAILIAPAGRATISATVYGVGLVALFGGSAIYHRWPGPARFKPVLQRIDHSTIFVFIAASYTPIALVVLRGPLVWVILVLAWTGAAAGVVFSLGWIEAPRAVIAGSYLALGWVAVFAIPQLAGELDCRHWRCSVPVACCIRAARSSMRASVLIHGRARSASTRSSTHWWSSRPPRITSRWWGGCCREQG